MAIVDILAVSENDRWYRGQLEINEVKDYYVFRNLTVYSDTDKEKTISLKHVLIPYKYGGLVHEKK